MDAHSNTIANLEAQVADLRRKLDEERARVERMRETTLEWHHGEPPRTDRSSHVLLRVFYNGQNYNVIFWDGKSWSDGTLEFTQEELGRWEWSYLPDWTSDIAAGCPTDSGARVHASWCGYDSQPGAPTDHDGSRSDECTCGASSPEEGGEG